MLNKIDDAASADARAVMHDEYADARAVMHADAADARAVMHAAADAYTTNTKKD